MASLADALCWRAVRFILAIVAVFPATSQQRDSTSANSTTETSGLISYVGEITNEGQQLPATRMDSSASGTLMQAGGAGGQFSAPKMVASIGVRQVGKQEKLDTVVGKLRCWPVSYDKTQVRHRDHDGQDQYH